MFLLRTVELVSHIENLYLANRTAAQHSTTKFTDKINTKRSIYFNKDKHQTVKHKTKINIKVIEENRKCYKVL